MIRKKWINSRYITRRPKRALRSPGERRAFHFFSLYNGLESTKGIDYVCSKVQISKRMKEQTRFRDLISAA